MLPMKVLWFFSVLMLSVLLYSCKATSVNTSFYEEDMMETVTIDHFELLPPDSIIIIESDQVIFYEIAHPVSKEVDSIKQIKNEHKTKTDFNNP